MEKSDQTQTTTQESRRITIPTSTRFSSDLVEVKFVVLEVEEKDEEPDAMSARPVVTRMWKRRMRMSSIFFAREGLR